VENPLLTMRCGPYGAGQPAPTGCKNGGPDKGEGRVRDRLHWNNRGWTVSRNTSVTKVKPLFDARTRTCRRSVRMRSPFVRPIDHDRDANTTININDYYDTDYGSRYHIETRHTGSG
jgi:hypothetical protein